MQDPEPPMSEEERLALIRSLKEELPHLDHDRMLMGWLAGPPSPDRPDLAVWNYGAFLTAHPDVALSDLTAIRFPVRMHGGEMTVSSIDEEAMPPPSSYTGWIPPFRIDADAVIRRYCMLHDAGVVDWDSSIRGIVYRKPLAEYVEVLRACTSALPPAD